MITDPEEPLMPLPHSKLPIIHIPEGQRFEMNGKIYSWKKSKDPHNIIIESGAPNNPVFTITASSKSKRHKK